MTTAEKQHGMEFDLDQWLDAMETWEHVAQQDDSDEARRDAFDQRQAEEEVSVNAAYYAGDEEEVNF